MHIYKKDDRVVYPIGTYENCLIKDRAKHAKGRNTSVRMKDIRDFQSSIPWLPWSPSTQKKDEHELLRYDMKSKNIEYKNEKKPFQVQDINIRQNIGDPIRHAGLQRKGAVSSRGRISNRFYDSQIVLGSDEKYMPMSTQKISYTNLVSFLTIYTECFIPGNLS